MTTTLPAGWKPIESAPKDGTPLLLFARLVDAEASTRVVGAYLNTFGWLAQSYSHQTVAQVVPSHWMELPPFPDTPPAAPTLSSLRGFAPEACDGMRSEDYVNKARNGGWSSPDCTPPATTQDDTLARTGNTADHQAGWFAGIEHGRAEARASAQDDAKEAVMDAIAEALGDAYDCTRVWAAWGVGTMSQGDFRLVADDAGRLGELADAAIAAMGTAPAAGDARDAVPIFTIPVEVARLIRGAYLPSNLRKLRRVHPSVVSALEQYLGALEAVDAAIAAQQGKGGEA